MSADHSDTFRHYDSSHATAGDSARPLVWLPIAPDEIEGLPEGLEYAHWDGGPEYPTDPARVSFYCVPYMKRAEVLTRPLEAMTGLRVIQTLTAGIDSLLPAMSRVAPGVPPCNARGLHDASTAELALTLILASRRDIPGFVRAQDAGVRC